MDVLIHGEKKSWLIYFFLLSNVVFSYMSSINGPEMIQCLRRQQLGMHKREEIFHACGCPICTYNRVAPQFKLVPLAIESLSLPI